MVAGSKASNQHCQSSLRAMNAYSTSSQPSRAVGAELLDEEEVPGSDAAMPTPPDSDGVELLAEEEIPGSDAVMLSC